MTSNPWIRAAALGLLALSLAACSKPKQVQPDPSATTATDTGAQTSGIDTTATAAGTDAAAMSEAQRQALAALQGRNVVFFEFDSSELRPQDDAIVAAHAAYLKRFPNARVRLEGHTDERGSREYNIGLGERRAQTVRRALTLQGVNDAQITTVSYGEERLAAAGADESAHSQNRRVEIVVL